MDPAAHDLSGGLTPVGFDPQTGTQALAVQVFPMYKDVAIVDFLSTWHTPPPWWVR